MNEANFASLSPSLLARKGGARPAMRPQLGMLSNQAATAESLEDLGWNDMGADDEPATEGEVLQLTPSPANPETAAEAREIDETAKGQLASGQPAEVQEQQAEITRRLALVDNEEPEPDTTDNGSGPDAPVATTNVIAVKTREPQQARIAPARGKRAAFTLRLDQERHLKLRLACTMRNRSAQQIVTEALDRLLETMPELEGLAAQVQRH